MPTILTRSAGSARGYGFTGNPIYRIQKLLQGTTWTAPPGVTSILSLTGKGQNGVAAYWAALEPSGFGDAPGSTLAIMWAGNENNVTPEEVEGFAQSQWDLFPQNSYSGEVYVEWTKREYTNFNPPYYFEFGAAAIVRVIPGGYSKTKAGNGWGQTWPPFPVGTAYYNIGNIQYYVPQFNGANTTGFGYTFAGGVGAPATPTTYTNVPVTPGTTYTINSAGDGYITIIYYYQGG